MPLEPGTDFAELSREKSTGPVGLTGVSLGWFGTGQMVQPFEAAVQATAPKSLAGPGETWLGWHLTDLNEKRMSPLPTREQVRPDLRTSCPGKRYRLASVSCAQ